MLTKKAIVHLDTGLTREHEIEVKNDADYLNLVNTCVDALINKSPGGIIFSNPYCIYRIQNIVAIEFLDAPPPTEELSIGFKSQK